MRCRLLRGIKTLCRRAADAVAERICPLGIDEVGCGKFLTPTGAGPGSRFHQLSYVTVGLLQLEAATESRSCEKLLATATMPAILRGSVRQSRAQIKQMSRSKVHWSSAEKAAKKSRLCLQTDRPVLVCSQTQTKRSWVQGSLSLQAASCTKHAYSQSLAATFMYRCTLELR